MSADHSSLTDRQTSVRQFGTSVPCLYVVQNLPNAQYPEFAHNTSRNYRCDVKFCKQLCDRKPPVKEVATCDTTAGISYKAKLFSLERHLGDPTVRGSFWWQRNETIPPLVSYRGPIREHPNLSRNLLYVLPIRKANTALETSDSTAAEFVNAIRIVISNLFFLII